MISKLKCQRYLIAFMMIIFYSSSPAFAQDVVGKITITPDVLPATHAKKYLAPVKLPGAMPDALYIPKRFRGKPIKALTAVQRLAIRSHRLGDTYHDKLGDTHPFAGFYAIGRVDHRLSNSTGQNNRSNDYLYGLEWEIFKQGYHEYKRDLDEKKIASTVQALQVENDMRMRALDEQIFHLNRFRQTVQTLSTKRMLDLTTTQLRMAKKQIAHGYITRDEYVDAVNRQLDAKIRYARLTANSVVKVPPVWFKMLNVAPSLRLASEHQLFGQAVRVSPALLLQDQFEKRADFFPEWMDNLSLRVFAHRRQRFGGNAENVVGIRARVPLDVQPYRDDVVRIEKDSYRVQASAIRARMKQKITQLSNEFQFQQARIAQLADDYGVLGKKIASASQLAKAGLPYLKQVPEKDIQVYERERLMTIEGVWLTRIDVLEKVLRLAAMTHAQRQEELFLDKVADDHEQETYKPSMVLYHAGMLQTHVIDHHQKHDKVIDAIESWRTAWSGKKQKRYFQSYADNFKPEHHQTISAWKKKKQHLFMLRPKIDIKITSIEVRFIKENKQAQVRFYQYYRSGEYHSSETKELIMQRVGLFWKIIREHVIELSTLKKDMQTSRPATTQIAVAKTSRLETTTKNEPSTRVWETHAGSEIKKEMPAMEKMPVDKAILNALEAWRHAWSTQDVPAYFAAYVTNFRPSTPQGSRKTWWTHTSWKRYKKRVFSKYTHIHVTLKNSSVTMIDHGNRARVRFLQIFNAGSYHSQDHKELIFIKQSNDWRIIQEGIIKKEMVASTVKQPTAEHGVLNAVEAWRRAWAAKDVSGYFHSSAGIILHHLRSHTRGKHGSNTING